MTPFDDSPSRAGSSAAQAAAFGAYVLERRLAVGGTSQVFLARRAEGGELLVIKRLLPSQLGDPQALGMFVTEARLHRAIRHPNVVEVFEAGTAEGEPFLAMRYVEGVDAAQLMRRVQAERLRLPEPLAIHVACCVCAALESVHAARDEAGRPLNILHRDVTPSNIYLSTQGEVLLGDFGIAREKLGVSGGGQNAAVLKGKYSYLAPEQVSGQPFDHRADLFACAVVCAELLLGRPLFAGAGQLAVLLAIRDGRIDALREGASSLSPGLFEVLVRALARDPASRFASAKALGDALKPFERDAVRARELLKDWVLWARNTGELARRIKDVTAASSARLEGSQLTSKPGIAREDPPEPIDESARITTNFDERPSHIRLRSGLSLRNVAFARIIQMIVTSELEADDEVDLMGQGFCRVAEIELLQRHLPDLWTSRTLSSPASPDESLALGSPEALLALLGRLARTRATGLLLFEGEAPREPAARRELYLREGQLLHVAASEARDMLGQSLVRRGLITTTELDMALAVLARFDGRLGDTLMGLGLIEPVTLMRAIEEQGSERVVRLFGWDRMQASFYRGAAPARVEFPLEVPLAQLMLAGLEVSMPNDAPLVQARPLMARVVRRTLGQVMARKLLPQPVSMLLDAAGSGGMELRLLLIRMASAGLLSAADTLRALHVGVALGLLELS